MKRIGLLISILHMLLPPMSGELERIGHALAGGRFFKLVILMDASKGVSSDDLTEQKKFASEVANRMLTSDYGLVGVATSSSLFTIQNLLFSVQLSLHDNTNVIDIELEMFTDISVDEGIGHAIGILRRGLEAEAKKDQRSRIKVDYVILVVSDGYDKLTVENVHEAFKNNCFAIADIIKTGDWVEMSKMTQATQDDSSRVLKISSFTDLSLDIDQSLKMRQKARKASEGCSTKDFSRSTRLQSNSFFGSILGVIIAHLTSVQLL